jgi:hypothetical protein
MVLYSCRESSFRAASGSMENTIMPGQEFDVVRTDSFKRDDIVVFDAFGDDLKSLPDENGNRKQHWNKLVFRLVAWSGDIVELRKGELFRNSTVIAMPPLAKKLYQVISKVPLNDLENAGHFMGPELIAGSYTYIIPLTDQEANKYRQRNADSITINNWVASYNPSDFSLIKACDTCHWTADDFGPLPIPMPGQTVFINETNFELFQQVPGIKWELILSKKNYILFWATIGIARQIHVI